MNIVAVTAGLSVPSSTRLLTDRLVAAVGAGAPAADVRVVELREHATDIAKHLVTGFAPAALRDALAAVSAADALIAVTPIFNASYSGLFKSFFDLVEPDALTGTPVLIAATGGTPRHSLALDHAVRPLFTYLHATVVPTSVYAASEDWGNTDGLDTRITRAATELTALLTHHLPAPRNEPELIPFAQQLAAFRPTAD